ncbi:MAG: DUF2244 domain-containing protein [Alphaproteobacteria bacterium]|nr:DUF2244 domain-containing protein [Alphaproteobacteria bacterium]
MTQPPPAQKQDGSAPAAESPDGSIYFDATLQPHRSLGPHGFMLVMGAIALGGFAVGLAFSLAGAWPVAGFAGLEILMLFFAFKLNYRDAKRSERLRLTDAGLEILRTLPNGRRTRLTLEPAWLSVRMDDPPAHHSQLVLASHGKGVVLGEFLTPGERLEVARALQSALEQYRSPDHLKA